MHARIAAVLLLLGVIGLSGYYLLSPLLESYQQQATSDAKATRGEIRIGVDNWVGYFPLCSPVMKQALRADGYLLKCEDDHADYPARIEALRAGRLDFAVATIDSYLLNGVRQNFPGTIVMVIDESKGGDAVIARKDRVARIDDLRSDPDLKVAFTPGSPSEHLLKAIGVHFDIETLRDRTKPWRLETNGSSEAREKLEKGLAEVAVVWEPDVSRVLAKGEFVKLLGTEDTSKLIVDILLVGRSFSADRPEAVRALLAQYFRTLKHYRDRPDELERDLASATGLGAEQVVPMLEGVRFATLQDNGLEWFGLQARGQYSREGIVDAIEATTQILIDAGDFRENPLPNEDPYRILYSEPLEWLFSNGAFTTIADTSSVDGSLTDPLTRAFPALRDAEWDTLREIGTLKVRPITFQSGTSQLSLEGKRELDRAAENLTHYPNFRVVITGHTGLRGDPKANRELSQERADSVARYLGVTYGVDPNRLRVIGKGAEAPLARKPGESARSYNYRLPRVEMFLVTEVY